MSQMIMVCQDCSWAYTRGTGHTCCSIPPPWAVWAKIAFAFLLIALLPACVGPGAIRTSEIRPLLLGQAEGAGILPRHDRYAEGDAAALRQSQAVRAELEEETTSAEELEAAGIAPVLKRHDAGVRQDRSAPGVLRRIWLQSSETMRRVLRASRGD